MEDHLNPIAGTAQRCGIQQRTFDKLEAVAQMRKIFRAAGQKVVQAAHPVTPAQQRIAQVRADEARRTGYQYCSHLVSIAAQSGRELNEFRRRVLWLHGAL